MPIGESSFYRSILDTLPFMVFVVDEDVRVHDLNAAALQVFGPDKGTVCNRRGGEIMHCLHSFDVPEGCGRGPICKDCVIRQAVRQCFQGLTTTRRRTKAMLLQGEKRIELELLITAGPLMLDDRTLALLVLEDISEFSRLQNIVPICVHCHKIRNDQEYWQNVEAYFSSHVGVDFSHSYCPACARELFPEAFEKLD